MAASKTDKPTAAAPKVPVLASAKEFSTFMSGASQVVGDLAREMKQVQEKGDAIQFARAFVVLHHLRDMLDQLDKNYNTLYEPVKKERLPAMFEAAGVPTVNLEEGYRVTVAQNLRASIREGQKGPAFEWLRSHDLGDLITETVNASTLSATAKSLLEEDVPRELDDTIFNVAYMPTTSVTKTKTKAKD